MPGAGPRSPRAAASRASSAQNTTHDHDQQAGATQNGADRPHSSAIRGAVRPGEHRAAHAHAVDAEREALALGRVPAVDERHADRERRAGEAEQEAEAR